MKSLKQLLVAGLIATCGAATPVLPSLAIASEPTESESGFAPFAPDLYNREVAQYHAYIARMSPENRAKLMAMQDKIMQMEMFILNNSGYPVQNPAH